MPYNENKIEASIVVALNEFYMQPSEINDVAFHMTDWLGDLKEWHEFCENTESLSEEEIQELLMKFLAHVPAHVAAASKLVKIGRASCRERV